MTAGSIPPSLSHATTRQPDIPPNISPNIPLQAPGHNAGRSLHAPGPEFQRVQLWQLIVAQLDVEQGGYSTREIAELLGVQSQAVVRWCQKLFPRQAGENRTVYWLEFSQAVILIRKMCLEGRRLPRVSELYRRLLADGVITARFPQENAAVLAAEKFLQQRRTQLVSQ